MKGLLLTILVFSSSLSAFAQFAEEKQQQSQQEMTLQDLRENKAFVETCPTVFLTTVQKSEKVSVLTCNCPEDHIGYIDISEGGPGPYCSEESLTR